LPLPKKPVRIVTGINAIAGPFKIQISHRGKLISYRVA